MTDRLPIIDQLHNAADDRARADILLRCPDSVLLKYGDVFLAACRHFEAGAIFVQHRRLLMHAVRDGNGCLPERIAAELDGLRAAMARFSASPSPCDFSASRAVSPAEPAGPPAGLRTPGRATADSGSPTDL